MVSMLCTVTIFSADKNKKCPSKVMVLVEEIKGQKFTEYRDFQALFSPKKVEVKSPVTGTLTELKIAEGDLVSQDWEMFILNDALKKEITEAEKNKTSWERILKKREQWAVRSKRAEAQARNKVVEYTQLLEEKKAEAEKYKIKAAIEGTVKGIRIKQGDTLNEGDVICEIENIKEVYATLEVAPEDMTLFSLEQTVTGKFTELPNEYTAKVVAIEGNTVKLMIENVYKTIKEGNTFHFKLVKNEFEDAVVLEESRLLKDDVGPFVYKALGKIARQSRLTLGPVTEGKVMILKGLSLGDEIITAEILSKKLGTLKPAFECLANNKKIKIMEMDPESKRYKKRKKKKVVKKEEEKIEEIPEVKIPEKKENYFSAELGIGYYSVNQSSFSSIYGNGEISFSLRADYTIKDKFMIFIEGNLFSSEGQLSETKETTSISYIPVAVGGQYLFKTSSKFKPYGGVAVFLGMMSEENPIDPAGFSESALGVSVLGGTYFEISDKISLNLLLRYDLISYSVQGMEADSDFSGARVFLFFTYKFK